MIEGIPLYRCTSCDSAYFPARLLCHRCGGANWREERVHEGEVEEFTWVRHAIGQENWTPRKIASVRLPGGQAIVAGIADDVETGARVALYEEQGSPKGRLPTA